MKTPFARSTPKAQVAADGVTVTGADPTDVGAVLDAAHIFDPMLRADFAAARALLAHHGTSYALATLTLAPAQRPYVWALYAFARYADEFVDSFVNPDPAALREWSDRFWHSANDALNHPTASHLSGTELAERGLDQFSRAMVHTMARWQIKPALVRAFLDSMLMDITVTEYETYADLAEYMYGSAAVIGLQMLPILQPIVPLAEAEPRARALGEAFQLTNFLRDVSEDLARGRCYLPLSDLARHGVSVADLQKARASGHVGAPVRAALAHVGRRTEQLYAFAEPGIDMLHPVSRPGIACALALYRGIFEQIRRSNYDVFSGRHVVPTWRRALWVAPSAAAAVWSRRGGRGDDLAPPNQPRTARFTPQPPHADVITVRPGHNPSSVGRHVRQTVDVTEPTIEPTIFLPANTQPTADAEHH